MIPDINKINSDKKPLLVTLSLCLLLMVTGNRAVAQQQAFSYTQYMDNLTPFNPAYSLLDKAGSINTLARRQWVGVDGAPVTYLITGNLPIESINASAGVIVFNDQVAIECQTEANVYFAKGIQLDSRSILAVSINAGVRNYTANYSTLDATDPTFRNDVRGTKPNMGFGVMYYTDWYYLGVSVPELTITSLGTASVQDNTNFRNHYYFSGALITNVNEDIKFKPATLFSYAKGVPLTADISGIFYMKGTLGLGLNYRTDKEMSGILTLNINAFHVGYGYQFGTSSTNLGTFNNATHEISLSYRFGRWASDPKLL
ncbi:PorP/SprF family type IX secretion system membrane protein [Mucilaginibacter lappiensis]|uniref:PorP/SprF family type IX secretion system membrane protein n=1 Tax=Mucilaginibacter lappiensis TaxID=354630 RepID=UPI003D208D44